MKQGIEPISMNRRQFLVTTLASSALLASGVIGVPAIARESTAFELPPLPYPEDALTPYISSRTLSFHYGKHHQGYVNNVNKLTKGTKLAEFSLEKIIRATAGNRTKVATFNNAAQAWNHSFYWKSMRPKGGGTPTGKVADKISGEFGSFGNFKEEFTTAATTQFGSGWAWLVMDGNSLKVVKTSNADTPLAHGQTPLLTVDVWEHAYYLDYQNRRKAYVTAFLAHLVNWDFAGENLDKIRVGRN